MESEDVDYDPPSDSLDTSEQYPHLLLRLRNNYIRPIEVRGRIPRECYPTLHMARPKLQQTAGESPGEASPTYSAAADLLIHLPADQPALYMRMAAKVGVLIERDDEFCVRQWQKLACIAIYIYMQYVRLYPNCGNQRGYAQHRPSGGTQGH